MDTFRWNYIVTHGNVEYIIIVCVCSKFRVRMNITLILVLVVCEVKKNLCTGGVYGEREETTNIYYS